VKPLADHRLKVIGMVMILLLLVSILVIASPWGKGSHQVKYGCKSCGTTGNKDLQTSRSEPVIEKLEGQEKEAAVSRALNSEDFKLIASFLDTEGLRFTLEDAVALKFIRLIDKRSWEYVVVGINFTGDVEARRVTAIIVLEPYQEARAYRLDVKRNLVELLVKAVHGQIVGGKLTPSGREALPMSNMLRTQSGCPACTFECVECTDMNYWCLALCCFNEYFILCLTWCMQQCCYGHFQWTCCSCDPASCFVAACMECPMCYGG